MIRDYFVLLVVFLLSPPFDLAYPYDKQDRTEQLKTRRELATFCPQTGGGR